ncbi:hypothetical protein PC116_g10015 [Phytophthora cactorum]|uniref:Uncharacterized protein n=1 Tax=Phytophthora cactorum TaxID=29920 RepID=A0A8T1L4X4_9STRA|nr:hypothetical protein Pcac1_g21570 [Phytophthora cactorum]KAG2910584.1 hypothetical protein PC114_g9694 [Phytophthora cactorum]KAG2946937.1 hypothetical protein PC117_g7211 [Phytophthora cactorum]KAG3022710.1 hypothetical protein PC120_g7970 [Phytophthora cactorum]KAG3204178.1 hypothetical protein PC128_g2129 [Phytophthora cactorum]
MQRHLKIFPDAPVAVKHRVLGYFRSAQRYPKASGLRETLLGTDGTAAPTNTAGGNAHSTAGDSRAQPAPASTPAQQQLQFEIALAAMFYLSALPFTLVESEAFRTPFKCGSGSHPDTD